MLWAGLFTVIPILACLAAGGRLGESQREEVAKSGRTDKGDIATLMKRTLGGHHGYGSGTSCTVKGSYCRFVC